MHATGCFSSPVFLFQEADIIFVYDKNCTLDSIFIHNLFKKFEGCRILVIGDVMVDSYMWGKVSRISPEAPVPVVSLVGSENRPGGAANVALNIHSLGGLPVMCTVIGTDTYGKIFRNLVKGLGMPDEGLIESPRRMTTNKTRIFASHQQLLRVDQEDESYIDEELESELWQKIRTLIDEYKTEAVIFQDYDKGVITPGLIKKVIAHCNKQDIPTLVDPKKRNFNHYQGATLFKPNFTELKEGLHVEISKSNYEEIHKVAKQLQEKAGFSMVMVTLSEHGMMISRNHEYHVVPTQARDVADVSGAGDTVIGMASLCLAAGLDAYTTATLANLAAGLVCEKVGVVPIEKEWLLKAANSY
jgi:rfaE bifunctional protein kinase chain/domain